MSAGQFRYQWSYTSISNRMEGGRGRIPGQKSRRWSSTGRYEGWQRQVGRHGGTKRTRDWGLVAFKSPGLLGKTMAKGRASPLVLKVTGPITLDWGNGVRITLSPAG